MSAPAFTPGPWAATRILLNPGRVITRADQAHRPYGSSADPDKARDEYMTVIAYAPERDRCHFEHEEGEANAHLIASAPALYAALKHVVEYVEGVDEFADISLGQRLDAARAALAQAEGREP